MSSEKIKQYINTLETHIANHETNNPKVSKATIGWQIDHSLKVINNVSKALQSSDPSEYKKNFSFLGKVFFKYINIFCCIKLSTTQISRSSISIILFIKYFELSVLN